MNGYIGSAWPPHQALQNLCIIAARHRNLPLSEPENQMNKTRFLPASALDSLKGAIETALDAERGSPLSFDGQFSTDQVRACANRCARAAGLRGIFWGEDVASWLMEHYTEGTTEGYSFILAAR